MSQFVNSLSCIDKSVQIQAVKKLTQSKCAYQPHQNNLLLLYWPSHDTITALTCQVKDRGPVTDVGSGSFGCWWRKGLCPGHATGASHKCSTGLGFGEFLELAQSLGLCHVLQAIPDSYLWSAGTFYGVRVVGSGIAMKECTWTAMMFGLALPVWVYQQNPVL